MKYITMTVGCELYQCFLIDMAGTTKFDRYDDTRDCLNARKDIAGALPFDGTCLALGFLKYK